jgi:hypothetical protein
VSLDSIVHCFNEGLSAEAIVDDFDTLTLGQVYGALAQYLENQPAIDAYVVRQRQRFQAMQQGAETLPKKLRQRLNDAREQLRSSRSQG